MAAEAERERQVAEQEQAERDRQAAEEAERAAMAAKAAAEQAERDRKAAEEAEQAVRRAKEAKEEKLANNLKKLPDFWENIALPTGGITTGTLKESSFLWENKDRVTISIEPFVNLATTPTWAIRQASERHKISFSVEEETKPIIVFFLEKDGISYEWDTESLRNYNDRDSHRRLNRIFLSKLRIEIAGIESKEVALWTPVECTASKFQDTKGDKDKEDKRKGSFTFDLDEEKPFVVDKNSDLEPNGTRMFLEINALLGDKETFPLQLTPEFLPDSFFYAPTKMPLILNSEVNSKIIRNKQDELKVQLDLASQVGVLQNKNESLQSEIEGHNTEIKNKLDGVKSGGIRTWEDVPNTIERLKTRDREVTGQFKNSQMPKARQDELDDNRKRIDQLQAAIDERDGLDTKIENAQKSIDDNNKKIDIWRNIQVHFSIDLVKTGITDVSEAQKPENRLPLFRVVKDTLKEATNSN